MYAYLTSLNGPRAGANFLLNPDADNLIGRDAACQVVLSDPLSSRIHAEIRHDADGWWVRDRDSRNGTFLNDTKADEVRLLDGGRLRFAASEFSFHVEPSRPADIVPPNIAVWKTVTYDTPGVWAEADETTLASWMPDLTQSHDFLVLYQLSIRLLACTDPQQVVDLSLGVLHELTAAAITGFLWLNDEGQLKVRAVLPEDAAGRLVTEPTLTELVCRGGQPIWMQQPTAPLKPSCLDSFADAICVPLLHDRASPGALHVYKERGHFERAHFQFAKSLTWVMGAALVRTRRQAALQAEHRRLMDKSAEFDELIGDSEPMRHLKTRIARVARATGCLLIRGESGVGKELVARAVHRLGARGDRPLLSVNCAAIPRDLMESQLFGHKRGSFTGADADHVGWFAQADTGTLFLDEVGEMTLEGQAKLLRILDGHPFLPVGGTKEISVDVRVIAATNRDLREFVREKKFREDLYYRLSVFELYIPPLRERGSDIDLLLDFFLERFKLEHGRPAVTLTDAARRKLLAYSWPGNVRQLRNVLDCAVVMAEGDVIQCEDLALRDTTGGELETLRIEDWEKRLIQEALKRTRDNVPEAAKLLGIGRATLYRKIEEYGIAR